MTALRDAVDLLRGFTSGSTDASDLIDDPVLVIDADRVDPADLVVPARFPAVVVAVSARTSAVPRLTSADPRHPALGPDVAITALAGPPAPWVSDGDPWAAARRVVDAIRSHPGPAVVLAQVLRVSCGTDVDAGLVAESLAYSALQAGPDFGRWLRSRPPRSDPIPGPPTTPLRVDREGDVLRLVLNRPHVHNAYNAEMRDALHEALTLAVAMPDLAVELSGIGPSFCSGGDLAEFGTFPDPVSSHAIRAGRSPAALLHLLRSRTTVVLHGSCAGSGMELPAFAGRVIADPSTRMWLPELAMGLIPGAGGTVSLPRRIGAPRTAWLGLTGTAIDAATALDWGLVDECAEADQVKPGPTRRPG